MVKKFSTLVLAGLLAFPAAASADVSQEDLQEKIDRLSQELQELKAEMETMKEDQQFFQDDVEANIEDWNLASRFKWSGDFRARMDYMTADVPAQYSAQAVAAGVVDVLNAGTGVPTLLNAFGMTPSTPLSVFAGALGQTPPSQFQTAAEAAGLTAQQATDLAAIFYDSSVGALLGGMPAGTTVGDIAGSFSSPQQLVAFMKNLSPAARARVFGNLANAYAPNPAMEYDDDTFFTNRLRLNMQVSATENVTFKGRLAMYKSYGSQSNPLDFGGPFTTSAISFDGTTSRQPDDNDLIVDQAYVNWANIAGLPVWFSIGRRPTTDGPPEHIRMGMDIRDKMATPTAYMNYPFDGATFGYAYFNPFGQDGSGRIRLCIGRGFEAGPTTTYDHLNDTDFAGINWDVYKKDDLFINFQSFGVFNMFNVPSDVTFPNVLELALYGENAATPGLDHPNPVAPEDMNGILDRANLGNIWHTSFVALNKWQDLNYFLSAGWSRTDPSGVDEMGTGLLTSWWDEDYDESKDGYSVYAGARYDLDDLGLKFGLEYNWGSEDWIAFSPGHDDIYQSKLATRGSVYEAYMIYDIPSGWKVSKYAKAFMRLGYQHYDYEYTGSGFWLGEPTDIDKLADDPLNAQFYPAIEDMDHVYLTFEAYF